MSDLNGLFSNGAGATGSYFAGQNHASSLAQQQALTQGQLQLNEQRAAQAPLELQMKQAELAQSQAQLPGIVGQSKSLGAQGQYDEATVQPRITEKFSELAIKMGEDGVKRMEQDGDRMLKAASLLSKYPAAAHKQVLTKFIEQYGGGPDSPMLQAIQQVPDNQVLATLQAMGTGMATASSKFLRERTLKKDENDSQERINAANNGAKVQSAEISAQARVEAAEKKAQIMELSLSVEKRIGALIQKPNRTPEETEQLQKLQAYALSLKAAAAQQTTATVLGQQTPMDAAAGQAERLTPTAPPAPRQQPVMPGGPPAGYKQIGTSNGVPVYEGPDGKRFKWGK
jgi:hypothetical protein